MAKPYQLALSAAQKAELEKAARRHPKPYVRERATGILKVAAGNSLRQVAYHQLLRPHAPETVKGWCEAYLAQGLPGLRIKSGRGRKPAFFPLDRN